VELELRPIITASLAKMDKNHDKIAP